MTQLSARDMIPLGAHLGRDPLLRMRRVVNKEPDGLKVREMTSQEMIWEERGFGYRRR